MNQLFNLKRAHYKGEKAPHKPILLLALIKLIDDGEVKENKFPLSPVLISYFKSIWNTLVDSEHWKPQIFLPYFHMSNDKNIWDLVLDREDYIQLTSKFSPRSLSSLVDNVSFGKIDSSLEAIFFDSRKREVLKNELLKFYFSDAKNKLENHLKQESHLYQQVLESEFFDPNIKEKSNYNDENDSIARSSLFKNKVPQIYGYTCAISRLSITSTLNISMIDACHIEPWHLHKNDTIVNGLALTPTIHRAFDKHLITIDENYKVVVSENFIENSNTSFTIKNLHQSEILLPKKEEWYPSQKLLHNHREKFNLKNGI